MHAITVHELGGPEVMTWEELPDPVAAPGEVVVRVSAAGVNYMDVGARRSPWFDLPYTLGAEGAGRVTALGEGVSEFAVGDRVAWFYLPGSYAEQIAAPAGSLVPIPDSIDDETAAAVMMQGLTANHFTTETYAVKAGDTAVVHAAAGGVGLMLTQMIKARGGNVIGLVSREEKVPVAKEAGADHVLVSSGGGFEDDILALTNGEGAHAVYDGGGSATFFSSLHSLRYHGTMAYYGPFMGLPSMTPTDLPKSVLLSYPTVQDHVRTRDALLLRSREVFDLVEAGTLKTRIGRRYPLSEAAQAHADIESRKTTGKLLLIP